MILCAGARQQSAKAVDNLASGQCAPDAEGGPGCASSFETVVVAAGADAEQKLRALAGVVEVSRTGVAAISRGAAAVNPWTGIELPRAQEFAVPFLSEADLAKSLSTLQVWPTSPPRPPAETTSKREHDHTTHTT